MPTSLALPSSVAASTKALLTPSAQHNPRKRPRSDLTPEEKREARAHRNRIAAQNSRDKRKNQFSTLEQRVAELEDENRQLRDAISTAQPNLVFAPSASEREQQRERENQELRERIKVLEQGWSSVVQALAAAGQVIPSLGLPPLLTQDRSSVTQVTEESKPLVASSDRAASPASSTSSSINQNSPTLSYTSLTAPSVDESTRHLARMATTSDSLTSVPEVSLQRVESLSTRTQSPIFSKLHNSNKVIRRSHRQIPRSMLGCKTSCNQSRLLPLHRRRLLFLLLLRSLHKTRPPNRR